jgi:hypothetical protein
VKEHISASYLPYIITFFYKLAVVNALLPGSHPVLSSVEPRQFEHESTSEAGSFGTYLLELSHDLFGAGNGICTLTLSPAPFTPTCTSPPTSHNLLPQVALFLGAIYFHLNHLPATPPATVPAPAVGGSQLGEAEVLSLLLISEAALDVLLFSAFIYLHGGHGQKVD